MKEEIIALLQQQIKNGSSEEKIQEVTLGMIDRDEFKHLPESLQNIIYQLNMNDLNELDREDYENFIKELEK